MNRNNNTLVSFGEILVKQLTKEQLGNVLQAINKYLLEKPLPVKDIATMVKSLNN